MSETTGSEISVATREINDYLTHPDANLGRPRGHAFANFVDRLEAEQAVERARELGEGSNTLLLAQISLRLVEERIQACITGIEGYLRENSAVGTLVDQALETVGEEDLYQALNRLRDRLYMDAEK